MGVEKPQSGSVLLPGAMLMALAGFTLWSLCDASVRYLNDFPLMAVGFVATFSSTSLLLVFSPWLGGLKETFTRPKLKLRLLRGAFLATSNFMSYVAFSNLDMATAYSIIFLAPLLAKVMSSLLTKEKISLRSWIISAVGFVGVLIVVRPGMVPMNIGAAAALCLALFFSLGFVMGRFIGQENQTLVSLSLFQNLFMALGTAVPAMGVLHELTPMAALMCVAIGSLSVMGSMLASRAFACAPAAYIAPIHYVQIIYGVVFGAVLFGEYPDEWTIVGGSIIVLAGLALVYFSRRVVDPVSLKPRPTESKS